MLNRRTFILSSIATAASLPAWSMPSAPVTMIVPFAPGASADGIARLIGSHFSDSGKATIVVDNRPGAGGATGLMAVSRANADGLTLGIGATGAMVINPHVEGAPKFDPLTQLKAIAKLVDIPLVLVASPSSGVKTIDDVVTKSKASKDGLSFGSTGVNSSQHLSIELLKQITGARLTHVPYRGSSPAVTDVLGGQLPMACVDLTSATEHIKAGTLIAIGVTAGKRYAVAPDIPTFVEQGVVDFDVPAWLGMFGPVGISAGLVDEMSRELAAALTNTAIKTRITTLGCEPAFLAPDDFATFLALQSGKMKKVVQAVEGSK